MAAHSRLFLVAIVVSLAAIVGCFNESDRAIREKLRVILEDDLLTILQETADSTHLPGSRYHITAYKSYDEGIYSRKAEVDFYFLKGVKVKIVRKYRYVRNDGKWERYLNEYRFYQHASDSTHSR